MKKISNKGVQLLLLILTFTAYSCSTIHIKKNGYYQTIKYKSKGQTLSKKNKKSRELKSEKSSEYEEYSKNIPIELELITELPSVNTSGVIGSLPQNDKQLEIPSSELAAVFHKELDLSGENASLESKSSSHLKTDINSVLDDEPTTPRNHWGAIAGMVSGILSFLVAGLILSICAIIFSGIALSKITKHPDQFRGMGMAIAGLILGIIALILTVALLALIL